MKTNQLRPVALLAVAGWLAGSSSQAMQMNLAMPYGSKISPPSKAELAFYSKSTDDLLFTGGDEVVIYCRAGLRCGSGLKYSVHRNIVATPFLSGQAEALPANTFVIRIPADKLLYPGFYDLKVELDAGEAKPVTGSITFGWQVERMKFKDTRAADFAEFWAKGKAEIDKIPLNASVGEFTKYSGKEIDEYNLAAACIPGDYDPAGHVTDSVEAAKVTFAGAEGTRVHGWLAKPTGSGPFPAMLVLPGAGFAARPKPLEHARHGYLALDIQVHGQDVDQKEYPAIPGYYDHFVYTPPEANYMHRVYLNALQAVNYLASRADVDPKRIVIVGGSQGGRLTVAVGAIDRRVAAIVPAIAHHGNMAWVAGAVALNKARADGMDAELPQVADDDEQRCLAYYDTMNFAPDVRCPVFMNAGLSDGVSTAVGVFTTYQRLGATDKTMVPLPGLAHDWSAEFDRRAWRWLDEKLNRR